MAKLRFAQLSGEIPRLLSRLLPDTGSQYAENVRLDDGGLTPIRKARKEHTFTGATGIQTIYKFGTDWLSWTTPVNAVPGPVATDRLYYTGDDAPKMRVGSTVYDLAVPFPTTAPTVTLGGSGTGDVTTRLYVYTWVTQFDEESEPCPVTADVLWQSGKTVTLTGFEAVPTGRGIDRMRIYRSQSSSQNGTDLFLIEERAAGTGSYIDTHGPTDFAEVLPSRDYNQPPADLSGLIALPNGMMAGFSGKQLCFCEPYKPHAWPEKYRMTTAYPIVGLGAFASTVVAATEGTPYVVSGTAPENMTEEKIEVNLPCINARGVVDLGYSVAYPSNDGLVVVSSSGATVATDALYTRPKWQKISPSTYIAGQYAGRYFASYQYVEVDGSITEGTRIIDLTGKQPFVMRASVRPEAFYYDLPSGALFYLVGDTVYEWDALGENNEIMTWTSKRVVMPEPVSFGAILVEGGALLSLEDQAALDAAIAAIIAYNTALFAGELNAEIDGHAVNELVLGGDDMQPLPDPKYIAVRVYADGKLINTITALDDVKRLKGVRAKEWEIQVNGTAEVEQITIASTVRELNEIE